MTRTWRGAGWVLAVVLISVPAWVAGGATATPARGSLAQRLFGPVAGLAAQVQWLRTQRALWDGRSDLALARARTALALDPGDTEGWRLIAWHLAFERAAEERERSPARRLAWVRAGVELLERGEASAREPERLALLSGLILGSLAAEEPPVPWPGGPHALWLAAAERFERAAELGAADGEELAHGAREEARATR